jgi:hypothetical protein
MLLLKLIAISLPYTESIPIGCCEKCRFFRFFFVSSEEFFWIEASFYIG